MRGEGNHKIPGSFAPENMEKTGAERVKYSLACQHEDAIPIKFVSYAQKCPTVLCTFAVALRKESVDRNAINVMSVSAVQELIPLADPAPAGVVTASDWASVISAMTSQISVSTVVGVLATLVTAGIGLVFLWWGVRKAVGSLMGSFRSGRIRL